MAGAAARSITLSSNIRVQTAREYMPDDPDDPLKPCPLVPAHRILSSRMALHLVKCREAQTQKKPLAQCKFDSTHWVPKKELAYHMAEECDKRELFERYVVHPDESAPVTGSYKPTELPDFEEDWDDGSCVTYDPTTKAESEAVLRTHAVASKKERKRFRYCERRRLQELEREGKVLHGTQVSAKPAPQAEPADPLARYADAPPHVQPILREMHRQIELQLSMREAEKSSAATADVAQSLEKMNLASEPPKKDDAPQKKDDAPQKKDNGPLKKDSGPPKDSSWVQVGKGRRKAGKKH